MIGKSYGGDVLLYEYTGKGKCEETFIPSPETPAELQFLMIDDKVLVCSGKNNFIIDADTIVCHGVNIYWENEKNIVGYELREIMRENTIYNSELELLKG
jgi:hypothetical protein